MFLVTFLVGVALTVPFARAATNRPLGPHHLHRFARRHQLGITAFNGNGVIAFIQVNRRFIWMGVAAGFSALVASAVTDSLTISPFPFVVCCFLAVCVPALRSARKAGKRDIGLRLAPAPLSALWKVAVVVGGGVALSAVVRSFGSEVGFEERLAAAAALLSALAVQLLVRNLRRRPLAPGPADLVGAEVATRASTTRTLLALGACVTLWTGLRSGLPGLPPDVVGLLTIGSYALPAGAWIAAAMSWQAGQSGGRGDQPWQVPLAGAMATVITMSWIPSGLSQPRSPVRIGEPAEYAVERDGVWRVGSLNVPIPWATAYVSRPGKLGRVAPFALSGDGGHAAYLDKETRRMILLDLYSGATSELTGALADDAVPVTVLSGDGRFAALTGSGGTELVDSATRSRVRLPGVGRVLGIGRDTVIATTGYRALHAGPDTELLTLGHDGTVRTRVPFDPTLAVLPTAGAGDLVVLTGAEVVAMDPRTGRVVRREPLRTPLHLPQPRGWAKDGRLLASDGDRYYLVDTTTGRVEEQENRFPRTALVAGRWA